MRITDKYVFFYRKTYLGNWHPSPFEYSFDDEDLVFNTVEQYFMFMKSITFSDFEIAQKILDAKTAKEAKNLGRQVKNYNDKHWDKIRYEIMRNGIYEKFRQNPKLKEQLLNEKFDNHVFVEASPIDRIWGVGMEEDDPNIDDERNWQGRNLMGKAITEVRKMLKEEE